VGKCDTNIPLGKPRTRWKDNIKIDLRLMGCGGVNWNHQAQVRDQWRALVSTIMNLGFP
jgi:hypothetical protein